MKAIRSMPEGAAYDVMDSPVWKLTMITSNSRQDAVISMTGGARPSVSISKY